MKIDQLILCSKSPRRKELLSNITSNFIVETKEIDETLDQSLPLIEQIKQLSYRKANAIDCNTSQCIIGADTIVCFNNQIYGKPSDKQHAFEMLNTLSNHTHQVITGVTLKTCNQSITKACITNVTFKSLTNQQIQNYIDTGSPLDKAGAYGIQDASMDFIQSIEGDYFNVVGLPLSLVWEMLLSLDPQYIPIHNDLA